MLVLTRKRGETIKIGSNIIIQVIKTSHGSVKIGIDAPTSVRVIRGELAAVEEVNSVEELNNEVVLFQSGDETMEPCMFEAMLVQS